MSFKRLIMTVMILVLLTVALANFTITSTRAAGYSGSLGSGSALSYYTSMCLNALFVKEGGNGTVIQYVTGVTNNTVSFNTIGYGSIYSFATKDKENLTKYFLMEMYNGSYVTSLGFGSGFPMFSAKEMEALRSGSFTVNGTQVTTSTCEFKSPKGTFPAYKVNLVKTESVGTGNITIWVNESNGVVLQYCIIATAYIGSATIFSSIKNWCLSNADTQTSSSATSSSPPSSSSSSSSSSSTVSSSSTIQSNSSIPSKILKQLENGTFNGTVNDRTHDGGISFTSSLGLVVIGVVIVIILAFFAFRKR